MRTSLPNMSLMCRTDSMGARKQAFGAGQPLPPEGLRCKGPSWPDEKSGLMKSMHLAKHPATVATQPRDVLDWRNTLARQRQH